MINKKKKDEFKNLIFFIFKIREMNKKIEKIKIEVNDDYKDNLNNLDKNIDLELNSPSILSPRSLKKKPKSYIKKIRSSPSFQTIPLTKTLSNLSVSSLNKFNLENELSETHHIEQYNNNDDIGYSFEDNIELNNNEDENDFFEELNKTQYSEPKQFLTRKVKKEKNNKKKDEELKDINEKIEKESILTTSTNKSSKNQLFHENPPLELVKDIMKIFLGDNLNNSCYQFTRKMLEEKKIIEKLETFIPELRKYYLKCKQNKYLENLDSKKVITIFRQLIRIYGYQLHSTEKYQNGSKFLLYKIDKTEKIIEQKKNNKKTNFTIDFD